MSDEVEIGRGKRGRRAYTLDDIALVPSRRTRDPEDVNVGWQIDAYHVDIPLMAAPMDSVMSPETAIAFGRLGGIGVLDLDGLWTRYEDPTPILDHIAHLGEEESIATLQRVYSEPIKPSLITERLKQLREAGVVVAGKLSPQRVQKYWRAVVDAGVDLFIIRGSTVSAEHVSSRREPLNLKRFIYELDVPVIVGGVCTDTAALHLMRTGAAGVLVGFGGGAAHSTRQSLGVHAPMATAIADVAAARRDYMDESGGRYVHVIADGGIGFDYRLGMAIPDFWIKELKEVPDEEWNIWEMWDVMTNRLPEVKTVAYAESHDQALVGDKTLAFRLMDKEMYFHMDKASENIVIDRGMALHKMIRLMTISTGGQAYLNFMGNEFGHPEWIDFPREGNGWSYAHARRQWSLAKNGFLRYSWLGDFDKAMIKLVKRYKVLADGYAWNLAMDECNKTMVFSHGNLLFVFNWHPTASIPDYELPVQAPGKYVPVLSTDEKRFGGQQRQAMDAEHFSFPARDGDNTERPHIRIYNTSRTATVYLRKK